jgi:hypothetical protein
MKRLRPWTTALALALALSLGCTPPTPPSDGGVPVSTPSSWTDTARTVLNILAWAIPAAKLIVSTFSSTAPETTSPILSAMDTVQRVTVPGFQRALDSYLREGGDRCQARAAAVALLASLIAVSDTSGAAGWGVALPISAALGSLGGIIDATAPVCALDAGLFASAPTADALLTAARLRLPPNLRPFPPIQPPADAGTPAL